MITATLYFKNGTSPQALVNDMRGLPEQIRPVYFAEDEGKIARENRLSDEVHFQDFLKANQTGFFLHTMNGTLIDVSIPRVDYLVATLWLEPALPSIMAISFMRGLVRCEPVFGFACDEDEYEHRNRYYATLGKNHIESWIGRRLEKYIPGVYWHTLLSDGLLIERGVRLSDLSVEAVTNDTLGNGSLHLLKFFDEPQNWKENACRLDGLCERVDGVFSRHSVEAVLSGITDYFEYEEAISHWR